MAPLSERRAENGPRGTGTGDKAWASGRTEQVKQMTMREREMTTMAMMREIDVRIERLEAEEPAANLPRAHVRTSRGRIWRPRRW